MVQDSAQIRRRGAQDFMSYYEFACARQESVPQPAVTMNLDKGILDFNGDRVKLEDWQPIFNSISINKHLHHIAISSTYQTSLGSGEAGKAENRLSTSSDNDLNFKSVWLANSAYLLFQIEGTISLSTGRRSQPFALKTSHSSCAKLWESVWPFLPIWRLCSLMDFHWEKGTSSPWQRYKKKYWMAKKGSYS